MYIKEIIIDGFGIFSNRTFTLSPKINIIFGKNGSGKSTLLAFIRACLFGFGQRGSNYRFEPVVGGTHGGRMNLVFDHGTYTIERKASRRSAGEIFIYDENGQTLSQAQFNHLLGYVSEKLFCNVFAFGLDELQRLDSLNESELAKFLYDTGLSPKVSLSEVEKRLQLNKEKLYKPRGIKPPINSIISQHRELKRQLRDEIRNEQQYRALENELVSLRTSLTDARKQLNLLQIREQKLLILKEAWPFWEEWLVIKEKLNQLPQFALPVNGLARIEQLEERYKELNHQRLVLESRVNEGFVAGTKLDFSLDTQKQLDKFKERFLDIRQKITMVEDRLNQTKAQLQQLVFSRKVIEDEIKDLYQDYPVELSEISKEERQAVFKTLRVDMEALNEQEQPTPKSKILPFYAKLGWVIVGGLFLLLNNPWATVIIITSLLGLVAYELISRKLLEQKRKTLKARIDSTLARYFGKKLSEKQGLEFDYLSELENKENSYLDQLDRLKNEEKWLKSQISTDEERYRELRFLENKLNLDFKQWLEGNALKSSLSVEEAEQCLIMVRELNEILKEMDGVINDRNAILEAAGCTDTEKLRQLYAQQAERDKLEAEAAVIKASLIALAKGDVEDLFAELITTNKKEIIQQLEDLQAKLKQKLQEITEQTELIGKKEAQKESLLDQDKIQKIKWELASLEEIGKKLVGEWGVNAILHKAIEIVREKYEKDQQPQVIKYASEFFNQATNNEFSRIFSPLGSMELKVEDSSGRIIPARQLSKGTIELLYLCMRFALIKSFEQNGIKLPVILDDILVNLDEERKEMAVNMIENLAITHQIIFLSCHPHIINSFQSEYNREALIVGSYSCNSSNHLE
ncbi:MAG: AAA family ATPase [Firmicutes bacterium]|nr:AAA family ATPase [Bacillota bacterium]